MNELTLGGALDQLAVFAIILEPFSLRLVLGFGTQHTCGRWFPPCDS